MISENLGTDTFQAEITHISQRGIWLLCQGQEYFLPFRDFPWFKKARIEQIHRVEMVSAHHLYWKDLDVDLSLPIIENPQKFPLVAK